MSKELMIDAIYKRYGSYMFRGNDIRKMSDKQVMAIYFRLLNSGQLK